MKSDLREDYARIGRERDTAGHEHDRERFWFYARVVAVCWVWVVIGGVIMAQGFHMNAAVGPFYFPELMDRAHLMIDAGVFVGTTGAFVTLVWAWRTADRRGYFD